MNGPRYAVIDVETTHGDPCIGRIIDVAVVLHDGSRIVDEWSTLVDPEVEMPLFIQNLTGLGRQDVQGAPKFLQVARMLQGFTRGRIVVAHNARYDMTVLTHEFTRVGLTFDRSALCTEQFSRRSVPNLTHYNLGSMCRHFGIDFETRHRALSDARAAAELFSRLIDGCGPGLLDHRNWITPMRRSA